MSRNFVITQGEHLVSAEPDVTISTLLGSCVACCLWDPMVGAGGMNHILLAGRSHHSMEGPNLAGINAMEILINELLKLGAARNRLQAKAFGGARMVSGLSDIGPANCTFLLGFLESEGIPCQSQSLGGTTARHLVFTPATGAARMKVQQTPPEERLLVSSKPRGNGMELF